MRSQVSTGSTSTFASTATTASASTFGEEPSYPRVAFVGAGTAESNFDSNRDEVGEGERHCVVGASQAGGGYEQASVDLYGEGVSQAEEGAASLYSQVSPRYYDDTGLEQTDAEELDGFSHRGSMISLSGA
jgi:hypothetical protein